MKKLCLVGLMMLAGSAWAEWVIYQKSEKVTQYYDPATILKDGNMRQVWQLQNLSRSLQNGTTSLRMLREYDCKKARWRNLAIYAHTLSLWLAARYLKRRAKITIGMASGPTLLSKFC